MPIKTNFKSISFILEEEETTENRRTGRLGHKKKKQVLLLLPPFPPFPDCSHLGSLIILSRLKAKMMKGEKKKTGVTLSERGFEDPLSVSSIFPIRFRAIKSGLLKIWVLTVMHLPKTSQGPERRRDG